MTAAEKLAVVKQLRPFVDTTIDTDAIYAAFILIAGQAVNNRAYPYDNIDPDRIVESTNMIVGAYTIAAQPDRPRNITVTVTAEDTADTMGTIVVTGTDNDGTAQTETIVPIANVTVNGTKVFKRVNSIVGAGWVIGSTNDTITVGVGELQAVPTKHEYRQCEIAAFLLNKRGAEGQTVHNENGVNRQYEGGNIPASMLADIVPFCGVHA